MNITHHIGFMLLGCISLLVSCTKDITVDLQPDEEKYVVEGYIETNEPPYITLTQTAPFYGEISLDDIDNSFIHNAEIWVSDGVDSVQLEEYCLLDFLTLVGNDTALLIQLTQNLGYGIIESEDVQIPNICIYTIPDFLNYIITGQASFLGVNETTYTLSVDIDGYTMTATTTIPKSNPYNFLEIRDHPNPDQDSLKSVYMNISVPSEFGNFVRYWTKRNDEPFYPPLSLSAYDDKLFSGLTISLPVERGQPQSEDIDFDTYGYFEVGDTVWLKWGNIDKEHYDFWNTIENQGGSSPFSAPIEVESNINGGLGIWGGYAVYIGDSIVVQ